LDGLKNLLASEKLFLGHLAPIMSPLVTKVSLPAAACQWGRRSMSAS